MIFPLNPNARDILFVYMRTNQNSTRRVGEATKLVSGLGSNYNKLKSQNKILMSLGDIINCHFEALKNMLNTLIWNLVTPLSPHLSITPILNNSL